MELIDTHTHLYLQEFEEDIATVIQTAKSNGVQRFFLPGIDSNVIDKMLALEAQYPNVCIPMLGLHPCSVNEDYKNELVIIEQWLAKRKFVAIGEIGLDFYWDKTFTMQQYEAFNQQMEIALKHKLPIVIHSRDAMRETIDAVIPFSEKGLIGIFHCFGGSAEDASAITNMGFYLGIGGVLTYKKSGLMEVMENVSLDHVVLETDSPYLSPVPYRGKRNESSYILLVAEKLAEIKKITVAEVAERTTANAEKIFGR